MSNRSVYSYRSGDSYSSCTGNSTRSRQKSKSHLALQASRALNRRKQEIQNRNRLHVPGEVKPSTRIEPIKPVSAHTQSEPTSTDKYDINNTMNTPKVDNSKPRIEPFATPRNGQRGSAFSSPKNPFSPSKREQGQPPLPPQMKYDTRSEYENREDIGPAVTEKDITAVPSHASERDGPPMTVHSLSFPYSVGTLNQDEMSHISDVHEKREDGEHIIPEPLVWHNEEDFKEFEGEMKQPHDRLRKLLSTMRDDKTSTSHRVNACGALKTLSASKKNRPRLARTWGVVTGLSMVMLNERSTVEERLRCMTALLHLCIPDQNWRIVFCSEGFVQALASGIDDDYPKVRHTACMCLEILAKLEANRVSIIKDNNILKSASNMIGFALDYYNGTDEEKDAGSHEVLAMKAARMSVLKALLSVAKSRQVSYDFARSQIITDVLVRVSGTMEAEANAVCTSIMMNITRLPDNALHVVFQVNDFVTTLVQAVDSDHEDSSTCALFGLQNLSCFSTCRQELANIDKLLVAVTRKAFGSKSADQRLAAMHTLKNLSDDPSNLISMTNTPGCVATLLALTNERGDKMLQYLACDTIAHLAHWLQTSAQKGADLEGHNSHQLPTLEQAVWEQWR